MEKCGDGFDLIVSSDLSSVLNRVGLVGLKYFVVGFVPSWVQKILAWVRKISMWVNFFSWVPENLLGVNFFYIFFIRTIGLFLNYHYAESCEGIYFFFIAFF